MKRNIPRKRKKERKKYTWKYGDKKFERGRKIRARTYEDERSTTASRDAQLTHHNDSVGVVHNMDEGGRREEEEVRASRAVSHIRGA